MQTDAPGNLALWRAVERTPKDQTKAITGKAYSGTSPKPHYLVMKATETFGPCGIGWGFNIVRERIEEGADGAKVHIAHIRVWYNWNGQRGEVEHVGQTMFSGHRNSGAAFTDEDAPKKSVTDGLVKALSMIGFAGDIFMGRYDDSKYIAELKAEQAPPPSLKRQTASLSGPFIDALEMALTVDDLSTWAIENKPAISKLTADDQAAIRDAYAAHRTKLAEAEYQKEAAE